MRTEPEPQTRVLSTIATQERLLARYLKYSSGRRVGKG